MSRNRNSQSAPAVMEQLEQRALLSGTVLVNFSPTSISIKGDTSGQGIFVSDGGVGTPYTVTATDGDTTIISRGMPPNSSDLVNLKINMGAGSDSVSVNVAAARNVSVSAAGDAMIGFGGTIYGKVSVKTGAGADNISSSANIAGRLSIVSGGGNDRIGIGSGVLNGLTINSGAGDDMVTISTAPGSVDVTVNLSTIVKLGTGNDTLSFAVGAPGTLTATFNANASFDLGAGNDTLNVGPTTPVLTFKGKVNSINFGAGDDVAGTIVDNSIHVGTGSSTRFIDPSGIKSVDLFTSLSKVVVDGLPKLLSVQF